MERVNPVKITAEDGRVFTLDFDRETALYAEEHGFVIDDVEKFPMSSSYKLFYFALRKNHPHYTYDRAKDLLDELFGGLTGLPERFMERLGLLYAQSAGSLNDEDAVKNVKATVEF